MHLEAHEYPLRGAMLMTNAMPWMPVESGSISLVASEGESDVYRFAGGPSAAGAEARIPAEELDVWQHALESVTSPEQARVAHMVTSDGSAEEVACVAPIAEPPSLPLTRTGGPDAWREARVPNVHRRVSLRGGGAIPSGRAHRREVPDDLGVKQWTPRD